MVFISNFRDDAERKKYLIRSQVGSEFIDGFRINMSGVYGRLKIINTDTHELLTTKGRRKAKKQFLSATKWAVDNGAKVVLLAASTKRLFGRDAKELKEKFPNTIFTIGDNGTAHLLLLDTLEAIKRVGLTKEKATIVVLGATGILGKIMVELLSQKGYTVVAVSNNMERLENLQEKYKVKTCASLEALKEVDLLVACTHKKGMLLTKNSILSMKRKDSKLVVVDVAEPANLSEEIYAENKMMVTRQDAGNAYSKNISFVLGALSYKKLSLSKGVIFGCFAEAMTIAWAMKNNHNTNWFNVSVENMEMIASYFEELDISNPSPRCFGELV